MKGKVLAALPLLLLAPLPLTAAEEAPIPIPSPSGWVWDGRVGFDWSERPNMTHVTLDAMNPINTIDLGAIKTPALDIELSGLEPGQTLRIEGVAGEVLDFPGIAYSSGNFIIWDILAVPGTISILDADDGALMTLIVLDHETMPLGRGRSPPPNNPNPQCCARGNGQQAQPPRPVAVKSEPYVSVALNGAVSTTPEVKISVTQCWTHANTIAGKATGGKALKATVGGSYTWSEETCTVINSQGAGQLGVSLSPFYGEQYDDGSKKVWATGSPNGYGSIGWSWTPPRCCRPYWVENAQTNGPQGFFLREDGSGSIAFTGAWNFWLVSGEASTTSAWGNKAQVHFTFAPNDNARHTYTWNVLTGDGKASGMLGWVYKDS